MVVFVCTKNDDVIYDCTHTVNVLKDLVYSLVVNFWC